MMKTGLGQGLLTLALLLVGGVPAFAQARDTTSSDILRRLQLEGQEIDASRRLMTPGWLTMSERWTLDIGGMARTGVYGIDDQTGEGHYLWQNDDLIYARADLDGGQTFYGRLRLLFDDWNADDSFDGEGDQLHDAIGDRWWYQFDTRRMIQSQHGRTPDWNVNLKAGRQFVQWGSGLTLSQTLFAGLLQVDLGDLTLTGLAGLTPARATVDFDATRPDFDDYARRAYYGGQAEWRIHPDHTPFFFILAQRDENDRPPTIFSTPAGVYPTGTEYDSEYWGFGSRGNIGAQMRYHVEAVYESGWGLSNSFDPVTLMPIVQTAEDINAWAGVAGLTYLFLDDHTTRVDFEVIAGTGDDDRFDSANTFGGNTSGTDDTAFNSLGYVNTGLALAPEVSNLLSVRLGASTSPFRPAQGPDPLRLAIDGFLFTKLEDSAPLNVLTTTTDSFLGGEIDLGMDLRLTSDLELTARYGVFFGGNAIPDALSSNRQFFYLGATLGF